MNLEKLRNYNEYLKKLEQQLQGQAKPKIQYLKNPDEGESIYVRFFPPTDETLVKVSKHWINKRTYNCSPNEKECKICKLIWGIWNSVDLIPNPDVQYKVKTILKQYLPAESYMTYVFEVDGDRVSKPLIYQLPKSFLAEAQEWLAEGNDIFNPEYGKVVKITRRSNKISRIPTAKSLNILPYIEQYSDIEPIQNYIYRLKEDKLKNIIEELTNKLLTKFLEAGVESALAFQLIDLGLKEAGIEKQGNNEFSKVEATNSQADSSVSSPTTMNIKITVDGEDIYFSSIEAKKDFLSKLSIIIPDEYVKCFADKEQLNNIDACKTCPVAYMCESAINTIFPAQKDFIKNMVNGG